MPPNTVYVGRPTKWGNPWTPEKYWDAGFSGSAEVAIKHCVEAYKAWLLGKEHWAHGALKAIPDVSELRGKVNLPHRGTVGEAVGTWIEHVLDELVAASPAGRAEQATKDGE
jgi:hypothetical protein